MLNVIVIIVVGYLVGSFPTAIITGKLLKGIDIREHGSGNAGGTNVFRVLGKGPGIFVMAFDIFKGIVATYYVSQIAFTDIGLSPVYLQIIAGLSAIVGHIWTIFAGFKGGKGVGTAAGMLVVLYPIAILVCFIIFLVIVFSTRYVSLGSILAAVFLPVVLFVMHTVFDRPVEPVLMGLASFIALLIVFTHRTNIQRLINGTENRFGKK
ncbi:MAG: glycerol-3-phosphate 1-O-acyltransferase PlsY [Deferribacteres bacterium]|nr:glycerol-3-phosphate 1-O-acyltransferase PlsY [candidate division KSB1 bacterium]MCB9502372.1 glycerol-3-phosphate 1-O-acyltransferase PlsY [Deferribacteres bacterium]